MRPETLKLFEERLGAGCSPKEHIMRILSGPHHFHLGPAELDAALAFARHEVEGGGRIVFPVDALLPADPMVLTLEFAPSRCGVMVLYSEHDWIGAFSAHLTDHRVGGWFRPGRQEMRVDDGNGRLVFEVAMVLSLINQPRLVTVEPASGREFSRAHRRAVQRVTGRPATAWSTVRWSIATAPGGCVYAPTDTLQ